jgi:hypothetical protein
MSKTYAIADLHGRLDLLEMALAKIADDAELPTTLVTLGDYVDRGPDSRQACGWRGMHRHGLRRSRRLSSGKAGGAVNVWRTSPARLSGGTRAASIGSWLSMEELLQRHGGELR